MRIGVVSDIHGNHEALAAALSALADEVDGIWCAGDIVTQYRFCGRTTRLLRESGATAIQGNHDMVLVSPAGVDARSRDGVDSAEVAWLASLPLEHRDEHAGCRLLMTHGSPWVPHGDYLTRRSDRWQRADELGVDILVTGHTHEPMVEMFGRTLVVNPGSIGEPRQRDDRRSTFAVVDTAERAASIGYI